jgi:hypothetical protein
MRLRIRRGHIVWIGVSLVFILIVVRPWRLFGSYHVYYDFGPLQVVGGEDEMWMFLQLDRNVRRPWHFEHKGIAISGLQEVFVFTRQGDLARRTGLATKEHTLHPNVSRVFRKSDGFFICSVRGTPPSPIIHRWQEKRFRALSLEQTEQLLRGSGISRVPHHEVHAFLDGLTRESGWRHLHADYARIPDVQFDWDGTPVSVERAVEGERLRLRITFGSGGEEKRHLFYYQMDRREMGRRAYRTYRNLLRSRTRPP